MKNSEQLFPVWHTKYARGYPCLLDKGTPMPLWDLLTREFQTDAHFAPYYHPMNSVKMTVDSLRLPVAPVMRLLVVDVDRYDALNRADWSKMAIDACAKLRGEPFGYFTRRGLRLVWKLQADVIISSPDHAAQWTQDYVEVLASIAHDTKCALVPDAACRDWTHIYRVPHANRDGEALTSGHACGRVDRIGAWLPGYVHDKTKVQLRDVAETIATTRPEWRHAIRASFDRGKTSDRPNAGIAPAASVRAGVASARALAALRLSEAPKGTRNSALFREAKWLAGIVAKGEMTREQAEHTLRPVAVSIGLDLREVDRTLRSAFE